MSTEQLRTFFGWCTLINFGLLLVGVIQIYLMADWLSEFHSKIFSIEAKSARQSYFLYLAYYKLAIIVFNLVPYVALRMISPQKTHESITDSSTDQKTQ